MTLRTDYANSTPLDDEHPDAHNDTNVAINALDSRIAALETAGTTVLNGAGPPGVGEALTFGGSLPDSHSTFTLATRVSFDTPGLITAIRYYRIVGPPPQPATLTLQIWDNTGTKVVEYTDTNPTVGWIEAPLPTPYAVNSGDVRTIAVLTNAAYKLETPVITSSADITWLGIYYNLPGGAFPNSLDNSYNLYLSPVFVADDALPTPDFGEDGDYYLDTLNHTLYGPRTTTGGSSGPTLVWSDEFTGTSLDLSKWESAGTYFNYGDGGGGNKFSGVNLMSQIEVSGSRLKMHAIEDDYPTDGRTPNPAPWKTAAIQAKYNSGYRFKYGQRMEVSVNVPAISGIRPAIWISNRGGYPGYIADDADGEIDLFEQYFNAYDGGERNQYAAIWDYSPFKQNNDPEYGAGVASGPETYALEWDDTIRIYRGGILRAEFTTWASAHPRGGPPTFPRPFHDGAEYWVLITFQIGGRFSAHSYNGTDGSQYVQPVDPAYSAVTWEVDYIRVYDMDTGGGGTPTTSWPVAAVGVPPGGTMSTLPAQYPNIAGTPTIEQTNFHGGTRCQFDVAGQVIGVRYQRRTAASSPLTARAWNAGLTMVAEVDDSTHAGTAGWFDVLFPTPVSVAAGSIGTYTIGGASVSMNPAAPSFTHTANVTLLDSRYYFTATGTTPNLTASQSYYAVPIFVPAGGGGQTLKKTSGADYAVGWA